MGHSFLITGGGTGGHIFPALAVAQVLRERAHKLLFVGTENGMEARLVPENGFEIAFLRIGGWNRVGFRKQIRTAAQLPASILGARRILRQWRPRAVFSMGGYVAAPVMVAAILDRVPLVVMEPNAVPGLANRKMARRVYRALLGFDSTRAWFPAGKAEVTGLPVRSEFFVVPAKRDGGFSVLITGGSRGARTLNRASRESWRLFRERRAPVRIIHQSGAAEHEALASEFAASGLEGEVVPFIQDMPGAFGGADVVIARAGAGSVSELAAAGMPSVLVPLPFAADDHQRKNAEAFVGQGAARMILDQEMNGARLFEEVEKLRANPTALAEMRVRVRQFARPGAADRAASVLEEAANAR
ncbi:MAG: undecaprenyldiphospho-muramoylpentapeptide beta-N-acetylglucosaminyltransferase [Acidobacteriaceae bacterium]|nr:undecaprenyldiphospho-muramoylpentapeptide beta-N-acetylglucosaminyltransferase [Acidobacteriaceae bacterium]